MNRLFALLVTIGVWFAAFTQVPDASRAALATAAQEQGRGREAGASRGTYISPGARHKLMLDRQDDSTYADLLSKNAILEEFDYGSFKMVVLDEEALGGRIELLRLAAVSDEQNVILLNGYALDTTNAEATWLRLPNDLRAGNSPAILAQGVSTAGALYLVQFAGPIQDAWLDGLKNSGVEVVSYIPNNAYVVRAHRNLVGRLAEMKRGNAFVQFFGNYEPAFRLSPLLQQVRQSGKDELVPITVQVIEGGDAEATINSLKAIASEFVGSHQVMNYHNVELTVPAARLGEIAALEPVFAVEERGQRRKLDEAQGQIVAGNLSGNAPSGPGYLSWLATKGFNSSQFASFAVNVVDDAYSLTGHPDLPNGRIAFENNPTNQSGAVGGHGFLNSHIIGGYNNQTGSAVEDANAFNYGLGIAPWARVGVTAIFGPGSSGGTDWENTAYGAGARMSSNSWGFVIGRNPVALYDSNAQEYDTIVRDAQSGAAGLQQMTIVFAAGNAGSGANTVGSPGTAKNVITVGAGENVRMTGTDGCDRDGSGPLGGINNSEADSANDVIFFSGRGPVNSSGSDGRVKPDIMAPGTHIQAGVPQSNYDGSSVCDQYFPIGQTLYGWSSGTSHSCPAVAGGAALVNQDFLNKGRSAPSPAMVKAYLMNTAAFMTGVGANDTLPSNNQGMGRMDLGRAFDTESRVLIDQTQVLGASGQTHQLSGSVVDTGQPLRVTLAWTDKPGPITGAPYVNNLDLEVTLSGTTYKGNVFSGANSMTGGTADGKNNVESVFIPAGVSGCFTITVRATNIAGDGVPGNADATDQDFALVVYNATTVAVSPSRLSFSATAGCSDPPRQTFNIANTCGGTWTASSNQPWLSLVSTSGTAPSLQTVDVFSSGLAAGVYNGAITITPSNASSAPHLLPVTLTVFPAPASGQLIINGGFEVSRVPWVLAGAASHTINSPFANTGSGFLALGGANFGQGIAYQTIPIPCNARSANLSFFLNVTSSETTTTTGVDWLFVEVLDTSGNLLTRLATRSNLNKGPIGLYRLEGICVQPCNLSLAAYRGRTVRVQFRVLTNATLPTTFRIDDVAVRWAQ